MSSVAATLREVPGVVRLAVPIVLGLGASTLIPVVDAVIVAPLGAAPLAAVSLTGAAALIAFSAVYGVLAALSVRVGHAWGAGQGRRIPGLLRNGLALGALVGSLAALLMAMVFPLLPWLGQPPEVLAILGPYWLAMSLFMLPYGVLTAFKFAWEAVNRPWLGTAFATLAVLVNVPVSYALVWGPGPLPALGLLGAGIAAVTAESVALLAAWAFWSRAPSMRRLRLRRPLSGAEMWGTLREGAPLGLLYVGETAAIAVAVVILGTFGTTALAANQVTQSVGGLLYMLPLGVAGAVAIRVAQVRGAGEASVRPVAFAALGVATLWLMGSALLLLFGGGWIAGLITADPEVVALAAALFVVLSALQIADGVQSTMLGALRGLSDTAWSAGVTLLAHWALGLPLAWLFARTLGWGPEGVWIGYGVALGAAGLALLWRFLRSTGPSGPAPSACSV